jgi:hypothetical protein
MIAFLLEELATPWPAAASRHLGGIAADETAGNYTLVYLTKQAIGCLTARVEQQVLWPLLLRTGGRRGAPRIAGCVLK